MVKYQRYMSEGRPGFIATQEHCVLVSATNMDAGIIEFGKPVARHATIDKGCTETLGATDLLGVTVIDRSAYVDRDMTQEGFRQHDECRIMREGTIYLENVAAVKAGDPLHVLPAGTFSNAGGVVIGEWISSAGANAIAIARVKMPVPSA